MVSPILKKLRAAKADKRPAAAKRAPKHEKAVAKRIKGKRVPGSGIGRRKGDVRIEGVCRIECKNTQAKSFSVTRKMLDTVEHAAICNDEIPMVQIEFLDKQGNKEYGCVVVPDWALEVLLDGLA